MWLLEMGPASQQKKEGRQIGKLRARPVKDLGGSRELPSVVSQCPWAEEWVPALSTLQGFHMEVTERPPLSLLLVFRSTQMCLLFFSLFGKHCL